ncbi:uncharacterized protein Triagg1_4817 [Trichoderma aggressivum f. europaeum]|uniref:Uncharacterized protein n=1 Tax=Trichoderma aggressivum f. europaeum TaxID=173218 RepID=A0AAE1IDG0_9HYPO|nr:hypothetical protein Triagg1_4817 [Trichoderma aggressivum f. europaeum]
MGGIARRYEYKYNCKYNCKYKADKDHGDTEHRGAAFSFGAPKVWTRPTKTQRGTVTSCGSATRALVGPGAPVRGRYGGLTGGGGLEGLRGTVALVFFPAASLWRC